MTPDQFRAWRTRMGYSQAHAAKALGYSARMVKKWEAPAGDDADAPPHPVPRAVALACAALENGLTAQ